MALQFPSQRGTPIQSNAAAETASAPVQPAVAPITDRTSEAAAHALPHDEIPPAPRRNSLAEHTATIENPPADAPKIEVPVGPPTKRRSLIVTHTKGRNTIQMAIGDKQIVAPIRSQLAVKVPADASLKLSSWFVKNDRKLQKLNNKRMSYTLKDIAPALKRFEEEFRCNWHLMKHGCTEADNKFLQIINDLRSTYLQEIFDNLRKDFPTLTMNDFGSDKLTSDRDFALGGFGADRQTMNTMIDKKFNAMFEAIWKAPSAIVFDSNAYTTQHVMKATDPFMEERRSQLQHEGSLLMKLRNGTPESWNQFKSATLSRIRDPALNKMQVMEFEKVEKANKELQLKLNQEILKLALSGSHHLSLRETLGKYVNTPFEQLSESAINDINAAAEAIKTHDPHIEVQASNHLYEAIKTSYGDLEKDRLQVFSSIVELNKLSLEGNASGFATAFNAQTDRFIEKLTSQLKGLESRISNESDPSITASLKNQMIELQNHILQLENAKIDKGDEQRVMQAFRERSALEQAEKGIQEKRIALEGDFAQFTRLQKKRIDLTDNGGNITDIGKVEKGLTELKKQYGAANLEELGAKLNNEIRGAEIELAGIRRNQSTAAERHGSFWSQAGIIGTEGDRLLIDMQQSHLKGMCFAQEAHVSEGAIGFVVFNVQAGKTDIRTIEQYTQAFVEVSGYCSGHQLKESTPHGRVVEASKYAVRLGMAIEHIQERAETLRIPPPELENAKRLIGFFKEVSDLRGSRKSEDDIREAVRAAAQKMGLIAENAVFDQEALSSVNAQIDAMTGTIEAWLKVAVGRQRNAYFNG